MASWRPIPTSFPKAEQSGASAHAEQGLALLHAGQFEAAHRAYRAAVLAEPEAAPVWHNLGVALVKLGRVGPAVAAWKRASALDESRLEPWLARALVARTPAEALDLSVAALARDVRCARAWGLRAEALLALGRVPEAVHAGRSAVRVAPRCAVTLSAQAELLYRAGLLDEAHARVLEACGLEPGWPRLWRLRWTVVLELSAERKARAAQHAPVPVAIERGIGI